MRLEGRLINAGRSANFATTVAARPTTARAEKRLHVTSAIGLTTTRVPSPCRLPWFCAYDCADMGASRSVQLEKAVVDKTIEDMNAGSVESMATRCRLHMLGR